MDPRPSVDELPVGVEVLRWPADAALRTRLARAGVPRVLLVDAGVAPPSPIGVDEEWLRLPATPADVRVSAHHVLAASSRLLAARPIVDEDGVLHRGAISRRLSPAEATALRMLLERSGSVVTRSELAAAIWPAGAPSSRALDAVILRLRRRLAGTAVVVRAARLRGFSVSTAA